MNPEDTNPFDGGSLSPILLRGLGQMGIKTPTPIQQQTLPATLAGRDVVGIAPTGTGKTLAYVIPLAQQLLAAPPPIRPGRGVDPGHRLRALVLCPVRELAQQVAEEGRNLLKGSVLRSQAVYGKSALRPQRDMIADGVDLLVGTPGRLRELITCGAMSLAHVRHVVVDEGDRMLDMGFLPQVRYLLARVPAERQMMFFSATMPAPISKLASDFLETPYRVEIGANTVVKHVGQNSIHISEIMKVPILLALVKSESREGVIIYARTRRRAGWVATALRRHGLSVGLVHGNRSQAQRQLAIKRFTEGELPVLVATDVAARGLHIPAIRTVINYDLPVSVEEYVHRVGRAGHGGGFGESFTLVSPREEEHWPRFRAVAGTKVDVVDPPECEQWLRPVDLERIARARGGTKALNRLKLQQGGSPYSGEKNRDRSARGSGRTDPDFTERSAQGSRSGGTGSRKKNSASGEVKFGARGKAARRTRKQRPIGKNEKPGGGVRRIAKD
jgi:ATP-dependent RNA helicase RhlE